MHRHYCASCEVYWECRNPGCVMDSDPIESDLCCLCVKDILAGALPLRPSIEWFEHVVVHTSFNGVSIK